LDTNDSARPSLTASQIEDLRLAASKMHGAERRSFQAEMALKYFAGSARLAETVLGWGRESVETGLGKERTGILCLGAQSAFWGNKCWEQKQPEAAKALRQMAESHAQQDPTFRSLIAYTRLTASEALKQLHAQGFGGDLLPALSTMAEILNRMGYRLRKVVKAKPQKIAQTDAIFANIVEKDQPTDSGNVKRLSMDCKATVQIGDYSRGGKTRGDNLACDHDMGCKEKFVSCGIVDEDSGSCKSPSAVPIKPATSSLMRSMAGGTDFLYKSGTKRSSFK
jgi:hypothetical protein